MAIFTAAIAAVASVGSTVAGLIGVTVAAGSAAAVAIGAGAIVLGAAAINALTPKIPSVSIAGSTANRGYRVTQTGSALDHQIIYGRTKVFGVRVFDYVKDANQQPNEILNRVIAFSGHEINSFDEIYFNEERVLIDVNGNVSSPTRYAGNSKVFQRLGTNTQTSPSLLQAVPVWTPAHTLNGISYLYLNLDYDENAFPNGVPEVSAVVKGKKVFDPRTNTTYWSVIPGLCLRDYLTNTSYGVVTLSSNIDDSLLITAAKVCDQIVNGKKR